MGKKNFFHLLWILTLNTLPKGKAKTINAPVQTRPFLRARLGDMGTERGGTEVSDHSGFCLEP